MNYIRGRREKRVSETPEKKKKTFRNRFLACEPPRKKKQSEATQKINFVTLDEDCFGIYKILERAHIEFNRKRYRTRWMAESERRNHNIIHFECSLMYDSSRCVADALGQSKVPLRVRTEDEAAGCGPTRMLERRKSSVVKAREKKTFDTYINLPEKHQEIVKLAQSALITFLFSAGERREKVKGSRKVIGVQLDASVRAKTSSSSPFIFRKIPSFLAWLQIYARN
jgi:hypothetical protein